MEKLLKKINVWPILLAVIAVILCVVNYAPNTFLSGWDTLHPEFDFSIYLKRIFFGVWQEHQGLGAVATQAHAAEIPRMLIYYPLSFLLPENFLRYGYFFLTLIIGSLGMFFFLSGTVLKNSKKGVKSLASFSGGLFYLLNLGTLQHYYLPLEMFATHFAFVPWLFLFAAKYLDEGKKKDLVLFSIITFFACPQAHTPTLFYAYFLGLIVFLFGMILTKKGKGIKKSLFVLLLTLLINGFWFLPHLYFVITSGNIVQESKISSMFSQTAFLTGRKFGNFKDTLLLKNFLFDWGKYSNTEGQFVKLFGEWKVHLQSQPVVLIGYAFALFVLLGVVFSIMSKNFYTIAVLGVSAVSFFLIANDLPILRNFYEFFQTKVPLFKESLRFPFTKFSILLMFGQAVFFGIFWNFFTETLVKIFKKEKIILTLQALLVLSLLVFYMLPAFKGNLINADMKVSFPGEYFSAMKWLNNQENGRIVHLPIHQFYGWVYYNWNYEGAGFWWFGLKNPLLDREFDRWNPYNEQFYWEASYAVYSKNLMLLKKVLEKYQVKWLILDGNIINPSSPKALFLDELEIMLQDNRITGNSEQSRGKFELVQTFGNIKIYKVNLETRVKDFVWVGENLPKVNGYEWGNLDEGYGEFGGYTSISNDQFLISNQISNFDVYYPFRSLFTGRKASDIDFKIEDRGDRFVFTKNLPLDLKNYELVMPSSESGALIEVDKNDLTKQINYIPTVDMRDGKIEVIIPKIKGLYSAEIDPILVPKALQAKNCNQFSGGEVRSEVGKWEVSREVGMGSEEEKILRLMAEDATNCSAGFWLPDLPHKYGYLISAETKNIFGKPLLFWIENLTNRKADLELYIRKQETVNSEQSYFIQPPMASDGLGYALHFDNISIGRQKTVNELGKISVNPIPYRFLTEIKLARQGEGGKWDASREVRLGSEEDITVNHSNPAVYEVTIGQPVTDNAVLVLSQAYHNGWKAFEVSSSLLRGIPLEYKYQVLRGFLAPIFGKEIKEHIKVNNWENGWRFSGNRNQETRNSQSGLFTDSYDTVVLVFWPQYLQYLGFSLLLLTASILLLLR